MLIKALHLLSEDLEATSAFYHGALGLPVLHQSAEELSVAAGATVLSFHRSHGQKPQYHFAFNIPCNKVEEAASWMKGKAALLDVEQGNSIADFSNWNAKAFYFLDNNENILEFIARNDLQNASGEPFGSSSILSISEIGIVCDNVTQQSQWLIENYGVSYFTKQPPLSRFAALGDDNGLFIVVPHSRDWYPTKIRSGKHWLKVHILVNGRERVLEQYARP